VRAAVSRDLLESVRPMIRKMTEAAEELERALGGVEKPKAGRPGRKPKTEAAPKLSRGKRPVNPRGSLQSAIREAMQKAKGGLRLSGLRDRVLEDKLFKGRDRLGLYNQNAGALKVMPDVVRTADKRYTLGSAAGTEKTPTHKAKVLRRPRGKSSIAGRKAGKE
jgi:hypothetical protein